MIIMDSGSLKSAIQNILNRWSGLKLSVEHQSGGRQSKEKALYLIDYIHEILFSNSKVESEDLEDLITDYMDNELQTIFEDDSVREVSATIIHLFDVYQAKGDSGVAQEISKLPHSNLWLDISYSVPTGIHPDGNSESESGESEQEMNKNQSETMDCEWSEVNYRKKR